MPMPSSGAINFGQLQTEFGGSNPIGLNEYYRGGTYVPAIAANASIPTSGAINLAQFYGATKNIDLDSSYTIAGSGVTAIATLSAFRNGNFTGVGGVLDFSDTWVNAGGSTTAGDHYEIYLSVISGTGPSSGDAINTWHSLSSTRSWTLPNGGENVLLTGTWRVQIRHSPTGTVVDTTDVSISVEGK